MVELRKRPAPPPAPPLAKRKSSAKSGVPKASTEPKVDSDKATPAVEKPKEKVTGTPKAGDVISLDGFGGEVELNDGVTTTLKSLVDTSVSGVVLFTYPKASTPGCK
jgi:peroxiredoxin Q/BCP